MKNIHILPTEKPSRSKEHFKLALKRTFLKGAKWQAEQDKKMYSEEDMKRAYCEGANLDYDIVISTKEGKEMLNDWFNKFKKK